MSGNSGPASAGTDVIWTKLRVPRLPRGLVTRARLLEPLRDPGSPVTLVCAPAGFGKSVLVLEWLREADLPVAWLSLDSLDNDPLRFFGHLAAAVEALDLPGAAAVADGLRRDSGSPDARPSTELLEGLGELEGRAAIVLDDFHEIDSEAVLSPLSRLLSHWD